MPRAAEIVLQLLQPIAPKVGLLPADVQVWQLDLRQDDAVLHVARDLLTDQELAATAQFLRPSSQRCQLLSKAIVRVVLGQRLGMPPRDVQFQLGPWGKPALLGLCSPQFNVTHSGDHLLLVLAEREVGVDVERIRPRRNLQALAKYAFSPVELAAFQQVAQDGQLAWFFRQWASKEALIKAWGLGLAAGLQAFDILPENDALNLLEVRNPQVPPGPWQLRELAGPQDYAAVLAWSERS